MMVTEDQLALAARRLAGLLPGERVHLDQEDWGWVVCEHGVRFNPDTILGGNRQTIHAHHARFTSHAYERNQKAREARQ